MITVGALAVSVVAAVVTTIVTAVIVAPIVEEVLFRLVLQGWLERVVLAVESRGALSAELLWGGSSPAAQRFGSRTAEYLPTLGSATLFALAHISHGAAPVPLFVLALGLGLLYTRTQRIVPCIVLHMLLNASSLLLLLLVIYLGTDPTS